MKFDVAAVRRCLKAYDFATLFREHLGWDKHQATLDVSVDDGNVRLTAVAQKRGFVAYTCPTIPDRQTRIKIDRQVTKSTREHFVIYADQSAGQQVWQWVRRETGTPLASRDHRFDVSQSGDPLIQRLDQIAVSLDEEEALTVVEVSGKAKKAFDVDKVTKKFYDRFKVEHASFLKFIKGIKSEADLQWYTSLMLNRLMFSYFIQKKGFLDGDTNYLPNRLEQVRKLKGKDKFQSFYRYFLLRLFHDGLGKSPGDRKLDRELEQLLGQVPYLNGGFFEEHELERKYGEIEIPDKAFQKLFDFFDDFAWHLDERPLRADNEINPDVVGYIFEKYINQKQMGAYYTKEDITEYISKNTIIPFLFDAAEKKCPIAFKPESFLWRLLRDDPDRYIHAAVRHGVVADDGTVIPLPKEIAAGINNVAKRDGWNRQASEPFALPTETWREHVARRERCLELREKLRSGKVHAINDLITFNLDIWQFARDAIVNSEGPELVRAFWQAIQSVTVLDPTCGSGAFLFAAVRILESLYSDCLQSMLGLIEEPPATPTAPDEQLRDLIARGENDRCEFKSTMRHCIKTAQANIPEAQKKEVLRAKDKDRNHDVLKSVAAMLNTAGGDVVVGVDDHGTPLGLENDYVFFKEADRNPDGYELWLRQLFVNHFGVLTSQKIRVHFVALDGKDILWLRITPSETAAYVIGESKQKFFYIRNGNETRALEIDEIVAYHPTRFTPEAIKALPAPTPAPAPKPTNKKKRFEDFRTVLDQIRKHSSERYFILKSIIISNLFGVDLMEEAVEICKLRLFLKLVAQVDSADQIEPLPDIDFNIRAGNTLVGYVSLAEVRKAREREGGGKNKQKMMLDSDAEAEMQRLEEDALAVEKAFEHFRSQQTTHGGRVTPQDKQELRRRLKKLDDELDRFLAGEYGVDPARQTDFDAWKLSHEPFHWFVEFYGIMARGGFDVEIGNPPYVEYSKVRNTYTVLRYSTESCGNLYAFTWERCIALGNPDARIGMIIPVASVCTDGYSPLQSLLHQTGTSVVSNFNDRPSKLFDGLEHIRLCIILHQRGARTRRAFATTYNKWQSAERPTLFNLLSYIETTGLNLGGAIAKIGAPVEVELLSKLARDKTRLTDYISDRGKHSIYYTRKLSHFVQILNFVPSITDAAGNPREPSELKELAFDGLMHRDVFLAILNSTTFYWLLTVYSDCRNLNKREIDGVRFDFSHADPSVSQGLAAQARSLMKDLRRHSKVLTLNYKKHGTMNIQCIYPRYSKAIIDEIDGLIGNHFGFSDDQLDFITNFGIKYRLGDDGDDDDE